MLYFFLILLIECVVRYEILVDISVDIYVYMQLQWCIQDFQAGGSTAVRQKFGVGRPQ